MKKHVSLLAAASVALTLSACGGGTTTVETNTTTIETNVENLGTPAEIENVATPEPTPSPSPTAAPVATGKEFDATTTQDDAEATGMTSRVNRGGEDNSSQPTQ